MKSFLIFFLFLTGTAIAQQDIATSTLEIRITGVEKVKGSLEVTLFNSRRKWLKRGKAYAQQRVVVDGKEVVVVFNDLPMGEYAMVSYHDINKNNKIDKNFLGIPKEPYAMTREAKSKFRKPYYREMKFECNQAHHVIETRLKTL